MKAKKTVSLLLCLIMVMANQISVYANEIPKYFCDNESIPIIIIEDSEIEKNLKDSVCIETFDLENGLECCVYEEKTIASFSSGTITKTYNFDLSCNGNSLGYLSQTTSWSYDGVNRPICLSNSNTFYSTDPSKNYLVGKGSLTSHHGSNSTICTRRDDVYYNANYLATTEFSTICDKNGNLSSSCTDV